MTEIKDGIYKAKALNYGITTSKDGNPMATVNLQLLVNEETVETVDMMWSGSLKEGRAIEITLDALLVLGYTENNLDLFAEGKGLNPEKRFQVTVEQELYNNKSTPKVKWINEIGSGASKEFLVKNDAVLKLKGLNLEAMMLERKQKAGLAPESDGLQKGKTIDKKDVPF